METLERGIKGGKWFSLINKVGRLENLQSALKRVVQNKGAAGVDGQKAEQYLLESTQRLEQVQAMLKTGPALVPAVGGFLADIALPSGRPLRLRPCFYDPFQGALQVFPSPYFIYQAEPFASFDSSFEGFQHALCPHACFRPVPSPGDFSALFSLWHSRQLICDCVSFTLPPSCPPWLHGHYPLRSYYGDSDSCPAPSSTRTGLLDYRVCISRHSVSNHPMRPRLPAMLLAPGGLTSDSPCRAVGGSSDSARCSQSRQSHKAVSSLCRGR